jgi:hypothetical protein
MTQVTALGTGREDTGCIPAMSCCRHMLPLPGRMSIAPGWIRTSSFRKYAGRIPCWSVRTASVTVSLSCKYAGGIPCWSVHIASVTVFLSCKDTTGITILPSCK